MASLKLLVSIIVTLALGATGVATVVPPSSIAANVDAALGRVSSTLGLETQAQVGTQVQVQNSKASAGASVNGQTSTQTTVSTQKKKGNTQTATNTAVNANSNANVNASANAKSNTNAKTNSSINATVNTNTATTQDDSSLKVATALANEFGVAVNDVTALHNRGWGYGEIETLYEMVKASGKSATDIETMRGNGMGWGEIAAALNLSLRGEGNNLGAIISGNGSLGLGHK